MTGLREFTESVGQAVLGGVGRVASRVQERKPLASDLLESDDAYLVVFDAPGAKMEDIQVRYEDGTVRVRIDRFREFHDGFEMLFPGRGLTLDGKAPLPDDAAVDPRSANATLAKNGTLRVEVPKVADDGPVAINEDDEEATEDSDVSVEAAAPADDADDADESAVAEDDEPSDDEKPE
ncbi:Hsp20/alpha crystallin family protein [Halorarius litoreus]|uniref:Hsp20/alpha crystallin family protein n=1 Tax=Halorarius litoreus TaxID=2962676 RepID=UPI0020CF3C40|nr:Hsp20/alpha crystallin family protein [Halorarius litoreus]